MIGYLVLESGETYQGEILCNSASKVNDYYPFERAAEVVFNTSHFGYEEMATDPSYFSQMIVLTAPQQGNYGIDKQVWESRRIWIDGFIALDIQNSMRDSTWVRQLQDHNIPLFSGIDTRQLTLRLRSKGTPWGAIVVAENESLARNRAQVLIDRKKVLAKDWVYETSRKEFELRAGQVPFGPKVAVLDFGAKENILNLLCKYSKEIKIFNSRTSVEEILSYQPDALMLTNGPGDPADVQTAPQTVQKLIGHLPIFGICMGHQILGIALGSKTYKLKFGHRGSNHPIRDSLLNQIYVSSQNHGYAVDRATLPADAKVTQINLNDQTVAGFYSSTRNYLGIQYHPESCPGPHEAQNLFRYFFENMVLPFSKEKPQQGGKI